MKVSGTSPGRRSSTRYGEAYFALRSAREYTLNWSVPGEDRPSGAVCFPENPLGSGVQVLFGE
jgi:hypothetical protein